MKRRISYSQMIFVDRYFCHFKSYKKCTYAIDDGHEVVKADHGDGHGDHDCSQDNHGNPRGAHDCGQ